MITNDQVQELLANKGTVVDPEGNKIGKIEQVYLDDQTNEPEWATASTGLFGTSETFVPLRGASVLGDQLTVDVHQEVVKDAPRLDSGEHLAPAQEDELYRYYGLAPNAEDEPSREHMTVEDAGAPGIAYTETETRETSRGRLRKYVVITEVDQDDAGRRP